MKIDLIHFFDDEGVSALARRQLERENAELRTKVEKLERLVQAQARKLKLLDPAEPMATRRSHH